MTEQIIIYQSDSVNIKSEVLYKDDTFWMTQKQIANLFGVMPQAVSKHLLNIFEDGELSKKSTCSILEQVQTEGTRKVKRKLEFYNLDAIIAVGYRVNSKQATHFRIWATNMLKEYIIKGFVLNDDMLKNGRPFGKDYFKELLERVRSIRASERRIYQQITDIFAECSIDYDPNSLVTRNFFAMIQNKFHYAITGKTASEIIYNSANAKKEHMGLTTWKSAPNGRILKSDVSIAKNYLSEKEIKQLERTITSYFDYIEGIIERQQIFTMEQFAQSVDKFLSFNEYEILDTKGTISMQEAKNKAYKEYQEFNTLQPINSDFDKYLKSKEKPQSQEDFVDDFSDDGC